MLTLPGISRDLTLIGGRKIIKELSESKGYTMHIHSCSCTGRTQERMAEKMQYTKCYQISLKVHSAVYFYLQKPISNCLQSREKAASI